MKIKHFNTDEKVFLIAEVGNNHEGDVQLAERMIGLAAESGADAVKFQTFRTEHYVTSKNPERFQRLKSFELTPQQFEGLARAAEREGVLFLSTPFDLDSARALNDLVPAFKISSSDNVHYPLLRAVAECEKPILLSTGFLDVEQIGYSKHFIEEIWRQRNASPELALLHCVVSYPAPAEDANLAAIGELRRRFSNPIGYSDHTLGIDAAVLSVAAGARIIEKHFTIDKNYSEFRDHAISADPQDMRELVRRVREAETLLGDGVKKLQPAEAGNLEALRRSAIVRRDCKAGETLRIEDLAWVRPAGPFPPGEESRCLGRALRQDLAAGETLLPEHFVD